MSRRTPLLLALFVLALAPLAALAAPTLTVSPGTVDWNSSTPIRVTVTGLTASETHLRLYVDGNADGLYGAGVDYLMWSYVGRDNVTEWSPVMFTDQNAALGTVALDLGPISPFRFPHTAGSYLFIAQDGASGTVSAYVPFTVTQVTGTYTISGTVRNDVGVAVGGAIVFLAPLGDNGFDGFGEDWERWGPSCIADDDGTYTLNVPPALFEVGTCTERLVLAVKPGYMTQMMIPQQPWVTLNGNKIGQDPVLRPGSVLTTATGTVTYSSGAKVGQGIPGVLVFGVNGDGPDEFTVAATDTNGSYTMPLSAHPINGSGRFYLNAWDPMYLAYQGAVGRDDWGQEVAITVPGPWTGNLSFPAANAFIQGTLRNPGGAARPEAGLLVHAKDLGCTGGDTPPCYRANGLTGSSGTFILGIVGGTGYNQAVVLNRAYIPSGQIAQGATCVSVSAGATVNQDLSLLNPSYYVYGSVRNESRTPNGGPIGGLVIKGTSYPSSCVMYNSRAFSSCAGTGAYVLPVMNGTWTVDLTPGDLTGAYRGYEGAQIARNDVLINGASQSNANFILGRWEIQPTLMEVSPPAGYDGGTVLLRGVSFSFGATPTVTWTEALEPYTTSTGTILAFRPELGELLVAAPSATLGDRTPYTVTVDNNDLGFTSNALCYTALGAPPASCALTGTVTDGTNPVAGAVVKASDSARRTRAAAVTDALGQYSLTLPDSGEAYNIFIYPPDFTTYAMASYSGVTCPGPLNHVFTAGSRVQGRLIFGSGHGLANSQIDIGLPTGGSVRATADMDGFVDLRVPAATGYTVRFLGPPNSHYVTQRQTPVDLSSNRDFGNVALVTGSVLVGNTLAYDLALTDYGYVGGLQPAPRMVEAYTTSGSNFAGRSASHRAETCQGLFAIALPRSTSVQLRFTDSGVEQAAAYVSSFSLPWDAYTDFTFPVFAEEGPTTPEPRFGSDLTTHRQQGGPALVFGSNFGTVADAIAPSFFSSTTPGNFIYGNDSMSDPDRGILLTRVPTGADQPYLDLELQVGADFYYSDSFPFNIDAGTFSPGPHPISGTVSSGGSPVADAVVVLLWNNPLRANCDDWGEVEDYDRTDATGAYSVLAQSGNCTLLVFPPAASGLAAGFHSLPDVSEPVAQNVTLQAANTVQLTVRDAGANPVPGARVTLRSALGFVDFRLTNASGIAQMRAPSGTYELEVLGPEKDRFLMWSGSLSVSGATATSVTLATGRMYTIRVLENNGVALGGVEGWFNQSSSPYTDYGWGYTRGEGRIYLPVPSGTAFNYTLNPQEDFLTNLTGSVSAITTDTVRYPSLQCGTAGIIAGTVTNLGTGSPLGGVPVRVFNRSSPTSTYGTATTCDDGYYRIKVPVYSNWGVAFNEGPTAGSDAFATEYFSEVYCTSASTARNVTAGDVTLANEALTPGGALSGSVYLGASNSPVLGASVQATSTALGTCSPQGQTTGSGGTYKFRFPPGTFQMQASYSTYATQCWDHYNGCSLYTPVSISAGTGAAGVDFDLGTAPGEVPSSGTTSLKITKGTVAGQVKATFGTVSGARAYSLYGWSGYSTAVAPIESYCNMVPGVTAGFVDNGNGTVTYTFTPGASVKSFIVSASNTVAEGTLGYRYPLVERDNPPSSWRCWNSPRP